ELGNVVRVQHARAALGVDFHADHAVRGDERPNAQLGADVEELNLLGGADKVLAERAVAELLAQQQGGLLLVEYKQFRPGQNLDLGDDLLDFAQNRDLILNDDHLAAGEQVAAGGRSHPSPAATRPRAAPAGRRSGAP